MRKELLKEVEELVSYTRKTHKYSMSKIYGLYNEVFDKDEKPQSCASCLIRKIKELEEWLKVQPQQTEKDTQTEGQNNQSETADMQSEKPKRKGRKKTV